MATYFRTKVTQGIGPSLSITAVTPSSPVSGSVTLSFAPQTSAPYATGSSITITGISVTGYNGTYTVTGCTTSSVTYANATTTAATGGTVAQAQLVPGASSRYTLIGCNLANTTDYDVIVSIQVTDSNAVTVTYINQLIIPPYTSAKVITGGEKLILAENCSMSVISDTANSVDAVYSYAEIV
jgi:hypothetical protein